jgi:hypothetical protein
MTKYTYKQVEGVNIPNAFNMVVKEGNYLLKCGNCVVKILYYNKELFEEVNGKGIIHEIIKLK